MFPEQPYTLDDLASDVKKAFELHKAARSHCRFERSFRSFKEPWLKPSIQINEQSVSFPLYTATVSATVDYEVQPDETYRTVAFDITFSEPIRKQAEEFRNTLWCLNRRGGIGGMYGDAPKGLHASALAHSLDVYTEPIDKHGFGLWHSGIQTHVAKLLVADRAVYLARRHPELTKPGNDPVQGPALIKLTDVVLPHTLVPGVLHPIPQSKPKNRKP